MTQGKCTHALIFVGPRAVMKENWLCAAKILIIQGK